VRLVLASRNDHKRREFARLMGGHVIDPLPEGVRLPPETGTTFAANALVKAQAAADATGSASIADDSGIEAEALGGGPGIRSARFAGDGASDADNLAKFRHEVPAGSRLAYVCALALVDPAAGTTHVVEGRCHGTMSAHERGVRGFGYDPVFVAAGLQGGRTMAELTDAEKDAVSHRGEAARALMAWLAG